MSVQNALAGLEMVNQALDRNKTRQFEKDISDLKEKYQTSERVAEQNYKSGENDKERAARLQLEKVQQGPEWSKIALEKKKQDREQAGRTAAAEAFKNDAAGQTPTGKIVEPLLESGAMSPQAALGAVPERSSVEWIAQLNGAAWSAKTPEEAAQYRKLADNAMTMYNDVKEQEAYRKRIAEVKAGGNNMMDYNYDPSPVIGTAKNLLSEKFKDYDPTESLSAYFMKRKQKDPAFSRESVREELNAKLAAQIVKTDPKIGGDYLRAYQASSAIWEGFETGGVGSLLKADKLDEEGNMVGKAKGWRTIPIRIDKNLYFQSGNQMNDFNKALDNSTQTPIFSNTGGQKPAPLATDHLADSYITGKSISAPVASTVK